MIVIVRVIYISFWYNNSVEQGNKSEKIKSFAPYELKLGDPGPHNLFASTPFVQPQLEKVKTRVGEIWERLGLLTTDYLTTDQNSAKGFHWLLRMYVGTLNDMQCT